MLTEELLGRDQHLAAGVLIYAKDTENWLFIRRSDLVSSPGTWSIPGGHAEAGETPWQTACRECQEEIGQDLSMWPHTVLWSQRSQAPSGAYCAMACIVDEQFRPTLNWEISEYTWCKLDSIPEPRHWGIEALLSHNQAGLKLAELIKKYHSDSTFIQD